MSITPDAMLELIEEAKERDGGKGAIECLTHFARLLDGTYLPGDVEDIIENDLENCTPDFARHYRMTWAMLNGWLSALVKERA